ncbi:MAG: Ppx/GppA family phosphatase [Neomegalonema sp.]|nr:Ppx/GppA family phosphatase [Neomegalonema sp.]
MLESFSRILGLKRFSAIEDAGQRNAVLDIGSNSVRLVVFDSALRSPAVFYNEKVLCGLGRELQATGRLSSTGREKAMEALNRFAALREVLDLESFEAVGTAAVRDAADGEEFVEQVRRETGIEITIATGADEARLAAQGVLLGDPWANGIVADIGGASMELVAVADGTVGEGVTIPVGPLRLEAVEGDLVPEIDRLIAESTNDTLAKGQHLYLVGGSWRALIKAHMEENNYALRVLHGFSVSGKEALRMAKWGAGLDEKAVSEKSGASDMRASVTPLGALVLSRLIKALEPTDVTLSAFGLREGILWERLPEERRQQDPLITACEEIERREARFPGFGTELWEWLAPTFPDWDERRQRLAHAACLLCDASWLTHPDYRSRACFELVTRNNFGGVTHRDRAFIGAALLGRDKDGRRVLRDEGAVSDFLDEESLSAAEALGRAMRLGLVISASTRGILQLCKLERSDQGIILQLNGRAARFSGEAPRRRLAKLAKSLNLPESAVIVAPDPGNAETSSEEP